MDLAEQNMYTDSKKGAMHVFIKTTRAHGYEYIKLVESRREGGKPQHHVLFNFGRADLIKKDASFLRIVRRLCEIAEIEVSPEKPTNVMSLLEGCSEATFYNYGYLAYLRLWKNLGIEPILKKLQRGCTKTQYPIDESVFLMAVQHLLEPRSKLATSERQSRYFNWREIPLHHLYRSLDKLGDWKEDIESELFTFNYVRMGQQVEVVFYDVTTFAFESVKTDELRAFGYSKDCKFNEVQVVMGMIIDTNGIPIGYELFPGNTFDGKTMLAALANIGKRFGIRRVIIVADRGINSKGNLKSIKEAGYGYIMASKIRGMGKSMKEKILSPESFTVITNAQGEESFRYKTLPYTNVFTDEDKVKHSLDENLIISYSPKRAAKDKQDRERLIEKARKLLESPEKIEALNKRGGKKYIDKVNPKQKDTWTLAMEKIEQDSLFDGYYGIQTSEKNMDAPEVMEAYHTLWKIEESFRIMKSTMEVRPIFHWTKERIKGHFVVCFLAFMMERRLELLLKEHTDELSASPGRIQEALNTMQLAALTANDEELFLKVKAHPLANKIFRLLKINMPKNVNKAHELVEHLKLIPLVVEPCQISF